MAIKMTLRQQPLAAALMVVLSSEVWAAHAESVKTLSTVMVKAAQEQMPAITVPNLQAAANNLAQIAGGANVVDAESYKTGRASTFQDALAYSPGVFVQSRFGAEEARLSIRGSGIQRTFHQRGIQLLQDGVPLNLADGSGDFQAVEPLAARYIEVYRGANALLYGGTGLGGAINFVSPTGYDAAPLQTRLEAGNFGYVRLQGSAAGVSDQTDYFASLSSFAQDGFRDHARQDTKRFFGNIGYRVNNLETRFYLGAVDTDSELPGSLTKAQLNSNPRLAQASAVSGDQKRDFTLYRIANKTTWQKGDLRVDGSVFYARKHLFHPIFQVIDQHNDDYGVDLRLTYQAPLGGRRNSLVLGVTSRRGDTRDDRFVNVGGKPGARLNKLDQEVVTYIAYAENQHYVQPDLALILGAQAAHTTRRQKDLFITGGVDESRDKRYQGFSPKLGLRYDITPTVRFFGNVSRSFEPPSFAELSSGPATAPVFADAQSATTFEIGSRGKFGIADWDISLYRANLRKELLSLIDPVTSAPLGTVNADKTVHQGMELGLNLDLGRQFFLRQVYLLNAFNFSNDAAFGNNRLAGIPRQFYKGELLYRQPDGFYAGPNMEWSPQKYYVDHANTVFADPYALLGFKVGMRDRSGFAWFVEGRNLTDKKYASTTGVVANAASVDQAQYLPGDGRSVYVGTEWRQ